MYWAKGSGIVSISNSAAGSVVDIKWTADSSGDVELHLDSLSGYLWKVVTTPTAVSAEYNVQLVNAASFDVLYDSCDGRSTSVVETAWVYDYASTQSAAVEMLGGEYKFLIDSAGNASKGVCQIHLRPQ